MSKNIKPVERVSPPSFRGWAGVARRECTPPTGAYNRNWGAAEGDVCTGVHRPLEVKVVVFRDSEEGEPLIYVSLELCLIRDPEDRLFRERLVREARLRDMSRVILHCTHTHAAVPFSFSLQDKPGGQLLVEWCHHLIEVTVAVMREALANCRPALLEWQTGCCDLAVQRDYPLSENDQGPYACGYNPGESADQTLVVGKVVDEQLQPLVILVHYACHPTTLAWKNSLISPDFVGAACELVEADVGCPMVFMQGASGELSPRQQYTADLQVVERNGRVLGYAVLSTLANMLPPGSDYRFDQVVTSGADLGVWKVESSLKQNRVLRSREIWVELPLIDRPSLEELQVSLQGAGERAHAERLERMIARENILQGANRFRVPICLWQLGDSYWIAQAQELYSVFQAVLRQLFPRKVVLPLNDANGPQIAYICPRELAGKALYQVEVSPFRPETMDQMIQWCVDALNEWESAQ